MNLFVLLFNKDRTPFEETLIRADGPAGHLAVIELLRQAEERVRTSPQSDVAAGASKQAYVDAIACARLELGRHFNR